MLEVPGFISITYLTTGKHPILLPPRLGAIMRELADRPPTRLMIQQETDAPRWPLFDDPKTGASMQRLDPSCRDGGLSR